MIDASWFRPGFAVVAIIAVMIPVVSRARRQVTDSHEQKMEEMRRLVRNGQRELLAEFRTLIELTRMEYELRYCGTQAAREPAEDAEQATQGRITAIVEEIQASPYRADQVRFDLPDDVEDFAVLHRDGPVTVHGPAAVQPRRAGRSTLNGLAALPIVGALIRGMAAFAQGTTALGSATVGSAAMASIALAPVPPVSMLTAPSAVAVTLPGQDMHLPASRRRLPGAPGAPLPRPDAAPQDPDGSEAETMPLPLVPPPRSVRPPRVTAPAPTPSPTRPPPPVEEADDPAPASPIPTASPTPSPSPSPSPDPSQRVAPTPSSTGTRQAEQSA